MAIRAKNIDHESEGMWRTAQVSLGDVTATLAKTVFAAPQACKVRYVDVYSKQGVSGASSVGINIIARHSSNSDASLQSRGTSATAATSNDLSANSRYRLTPSANNSLSTGQALDIVFSLTGTAVLSAVLVAITYTPLVHKESR